MVGRGKKPDIDPNEVIDGIVKGAGLEVRS
jgi:hypothetical protein